MAFPLVFINGGNANSNGYSWYIMQTPAYWMFCFTYAAVFYLNYYVLIPRLFLQKQYVWYGIVALILLNCIYFSQPFDKLLHTERHGFNQWPQSGPFQGDHPGSPPPGFGGPAPGAGFNQGPPPPPPDGQFGARHDGRPGGQPGGRRIDTTSLFIFVMMMALSTAAKTVRQWQITEQRATQAEADKTNAELSSLKAQINPHFLFNTLNNIYTLAVTKNEHTADSIMKLSEIMRYLIDDVTSDYVPLQSEIDFISNYIELQRLRIGKNGIINFNVTGNVASKIVAPLVLMTFVENVFKYGVSKKQPFDITINVSATDNQIEFFCRNQVFAESAIKNSTGIGISNTRQRLAHLYAGCHQLDIDNNGQTFTVKLTLQG